MCKAGQPVSLETKVGDGEDTVLLDLLAGGEDLPDEQIEMDCMRGDLHSLLHQLPDLQCRVLRMRYGMDGDEPMSLTGIGRVLGISRDRVRNLERDGLRGLRRLSDNVEAYFVSLINSLINLFVFSGSSSCGQCPAPSIISNRFIFVNFCFHSLASPKDSQGSFSPQIN